MSLVEVKQGDSVPFDSGATRWEPLPWSRGPGSAAPPSRLLPSSPANPASPPRGAALAGSPWTERWGTGSQRCHWSIPAPWNLQGAKSYRVRHGRSAGHIPRLGVVPGRVHPNQTQHWCLGREAPAGTRWAGPQGMGMPQPAPGVEAWAGFLLPGMNSQGRRCCQGWDILRQFPESPCRHWMIQGHIPMTVSSGNHALCFPCRNMLYCSKAPGIF